VAFTPDGGRAVSGSWDRTLRAWDLHKGSGLATFVGDAEVASLAIAPDGRTIVAGDALGRIDVYTLEEP
jgi:WD40 repeat protein